MGNLIVTEPTPRLIRIWENYGGKKSGSTNGVKAFDNFDDNGETGAFYANTVITPNEYSVNVKRVSEQEFIDTLGLVDLPDVQEPVEEEVEDAVNNPSHYTDSKIEVIEYIEDKKLGFHLGNSVKYISRAGKKDPNKTKEDLEKAIWYLQRYISDVLCVKENLN